MVPNWYVITGGPSSGKSTLLNILGEEGYATFEEAARLVIDEGLAAGKTVEEIRADEKSFQEAVLERKIQVEASHDKTLLTFFDRGMHDTLAYYRFYGWAIDKKTKKALIEAKYKSMFLLSPLSFFEKDYARTEGREFAVQLHDLLKEAYEAYNIPVIEVPDASPEERIQFILDTVNQNSEGQN